MTALRREEVAATTDASAPILDANEGISATTLGETAAAAIDATDVQVAALLAPVKDRPAVVFHDAYGYFAGHYGVTLAGSIAARDATAPGAARLAALQDGAKPVCVFPEAQHDAGLAEQLAKRIQKQ